MIKFENYKEFVTNKTKEFFLANNEVTFTLLGQYRLEKFLNEKGIDKHIVSFVDQNTVVVRNLQEDSVQYKYHRKRNYLILKNMKISNLYKYAERLNDIPAEFSIGIYDNENYRNLFIRR